MVSTIAGPYGTRQIPAPYSISVHGAAGKRTGALPSGRLAGQPLADGSVSPCQGVDVKGPTAVINSAGKIDQVPLFGTLLNMKFHPSALKTREDLKKIFTLIETYFDEGGKHAQFNVVDGKTLREAQQHPERHKNLMVRVAGYSAYFTELSANVQDEIILRTEFARLTAPDSNAYPGDDESLSGVVFNIQRCSLHDGPGIRTTVFLKGCPLTCFWCQNPESQAGGPEVLLDRRKCTLCGACRPACREGAVRLEGRQAGILPGRLPRVRALRTRLPGMKPGRSPGKRVTVDEVLEEVLKDVRFYKRSGGGVTLSGGEPLAQPRFAKQLFERCKREGLHTTLDTCGCAPWPSIRELLEYVDLVLFDIKHLDAAKHAEATGRDNRLILENAKRIAKRKPMRVRVPLIPGFNDSAAVGG